MAAFRAGEIDVLVCTTVIEVGVDVPNATVMLVMDADRFGISQLHQLRGRIGRGAHASVCLLASWITPHSQAGRRLSAVAGTLDGFELADLDLQERREGDVLGRNQSGRAITLQLLSLIDHRRRHRGGPRLLRAGLRRPGYASWIGACWQRLSPVPNASSSWTSHDPQTVALAGRGRGARRVGRLSGHGHVGGRARPAVRCAAPTFRPCNPVSTY